MLLINKKVVLKAGKQSSGALKFASAELQNDQTIQYLCQEVTEELPTYLPCTSYLHVHSKFISLKFIQTLCTHTLGTLLLSYSNSWILQNKLLFSHLHTVKENLSFSIFTPAVLLLPNQIIWRCSTCCESMKAYAWSPRADSHQTRRA